MAKNLKPPYPLRSFSTLLLTVISALFLTRVFVAGWPRFMSEPIPGLPPLPTWVYGGFVIFYSVLMYLQVWGRFRTHRRNVAESRRTWAEQSVGSAPLLRPAESTEEVLVRPVRAVEAAQEASLLRAGEVAGNVAESRCAVVGDPVEEQQVTISS